jgi:type II secretory pathway component PulK
LVVDSAAVDSAVDLVATPKALVEIAVVADSAADLAVDSAADWAADSMVDWAADSAADSAVDSAVPPPQAAAAHL